MDTQLSIYEQRAQGQHETYDLYEAEADHVETAPLARLVLGSSLYTLIALLLLLLRATERISWPWLPVTAPLWIPLLLTVVLLAIFALANFVMNTLRRER